MVACQDSFNHAINSSPAEIGTVQSWLKLVYSKHDPQVLWSSQWLRSSQNCTVKGVVFKYNSVLEVETENIKVKQGTSLIVS